MKHLFILLLLSVTVPTSGQQYWFSVPSGTTKRLMSISFGSNTVGYISGADSLLLKTTNGGLTWSPVSYTGLAFSFATPDIIHVNFVSPTTGFVIVSNFKNPVYSGHTYTTTDGGATWTPVFSGNIAPYRTFFFDAQNGYQIGSAFFQGKVIEKLSSGAWGSERSFDYNPSAFLRGIDCYNTSTGIVSGDAGYVHRTFNSGAAWDTVKLATDSNINAVRFLNARTILAAVDEEGGSIFVSRDTGRTWQQDLNSVSFFYPQYKSLVRSPRDSFIAVGISTGSKRGVLLWYHNGFVNTEGVPQFLREVAMRNDSVAYAVGDSGLIVSNAKALLSAPPLELSALPAVYPNPATGIFFTELPVDHSVCVWDMHGRMIRAQRSPSHKHEIDLSGQPRGIYIVEIATAQGMKIRRSLSLK